MLLTVFISSSGGLADERKAAAAAVEELGLRPDLFEGWPALSEAPEPASLAAVRESNVFIILLGARYGSPASTGRSIIHDEYLTARDLGIPVLAFRIEDGEPEPRQREFIAATEQNETIRAVTSLDDLKDQVRKAITQELVRQRAPEKSESPASKDVHLAAERRSLITIDLQAEEIEHLRDALTKQAAAKLNEMRLLFRTGRVGDAIRGLKQEVENPAWRRIEGTVRGRILTTLAAFELGVGATAADVEPLLGEAQAADPEAEHTYLTALIRYERDGAEAALEELETVRATNTFNLKLALLLDLGRLADAATLLSNVASPIEPDVETGRLRAFLTWEQGDVEGALRVIDETVRSEPASESLQMAQALISIASTIASEERPRHIGKWFEPIDSSFVVTTPEMLERLEAAAENLDDLLRRTQRKGTVLRQMQAWRLAALTLHPARRDAARAFAASLLKDDPADPAALVWSLAYGFDIDFDAAIAAVCVVPESSDHAQRMIAVVAALARRGDPARADTLLEESGDLFPGEAADLWKYWKVRILSDRARHDEALALAKTIGNAELRQVGQLLTTEHRAQETGDWDEHLQLLDATGSSYDRLIVRARLGRWDEIVDPALTLVEKEPTPVAVKLAATALFHLRRHGESLQLLRRYSPLTSSSIITRDLERLSVENQIVIGESQEALRAAEALFRATNSGRDLLLTIRASIVAGRQKDALFWAARLLDLPAGQVRADELLRISHMVTAEDRQLARRLWMRAKQLGFPADALVTAMDRAFALGLDDEGMRLATLLQQSLPDSGAFRAVSLDQVIEMEQSRQEAYAETWRMYAAGDIPLALLLAKSRAPLAYVYEMQLANVQKHEIGVASPLYIRHGSRVLTTAPALETITTLTVDVSTLLLAEQLGVLDALERRFEAIRVSPQACIALAEQQDRLQPAQPAADDAYALIHRLLGEARIAQAPVAVPGSALAPLTPELGLEWTALMQAAIDAGGFLVDNLPVRSWDGQREVKLPAEIRDHVRPREDATGGAPSVSKGGKLFLSDSVAFELAYGGALTRLSERFSVFVGRSVIAEARDRVETRQFRDVLSARLAKLAARIGDGFETGKYRSFPTSDRTADGMDDRTMAALVDFLGADGLAQHAFVVDDRLVSSQLELEGSPVITLPNVLAELRRSDELSDEEYFSILMRLRRANFRFIDLDGDEIVYWLIRAAIADGVVQESKELRILRVYLNSALSDRNLRVAPLSLTTTSQAIGEGAFGLNAAFAVNRALNAIWSLPDTQDEDRMAFSDWILRNLYTGTYGTHHLYGGFKEPRLLMVMDLANLLIPVGPVLDDDGFNFERGKAFLAWARGRLVDRRLDVDPDLLEDVAKGINEHLRHTANEPLGRELIHAIYSLLPPRVTAAGAGETEFVRAVDLKTYTVRNIADYQFEEEQLWEAIGRLQTQAEVTLRSNEGIDVRVCRTPPEMQRGLIFESKSGKKLFPNETFVVLAFDPPERQREYLRQHPEIFDEQDCPLNASIDALLSLPTFRERLTRVAQLEKDSAAVFYERLRDYLGRVEMGIGDLMPAVAPLVRHYLPGHVPKTSLDVHAAFAPLVQRADLLEALRRAIVLPVSLPPELRARFLAESEERRREILRELLVETESPVSYAHITVLAFASGSDDDRQLAWRIIDHLLDTNSVSEELFKHVLMWVHWRLSLGEGQQLATDVRLLLAWAHASKLLGLFRRNNIDPAALDHLFIAQGRAFADDLWTREDVITDVLYPLYADATRTTCAAVTYVGENIDRTDAVEVARRLQKALLPDPGRMSIPLMRDLSLARNGTGSFLSRDGSELIRFASSEAAALLSVEGKRQVVHDALAAIEKGEDPIPSWRTIIAVFGQLRPPEDVRQPLETLVNNLTIERLGPAVLDALGALAEVQTHFADDYRQRVEELALQGVTEWQKRAESRDAATIASEAQRWVVIAMALAARPGSREATGTALARLLQRFIDAAPAVAAAMRHLLSALPMELPMEYLPPLWPVVIAARAAAQ